MREIIFTGKFKRDLKKVQKSESQTVLLDLISAIAPLAADAPLAERLKDHQLVGDWKDFRECHIRPDLLLVYRKEPGILRLTRLASHSELFD